MWDKKGRRERRTRSCGRAAGGMGALRAAVGLALFAALAAGMGGGRLGAVCRAPPGVCGHSASRGPAGAERAIPASSAAVWGPEEHRGLNAVLWGPCSALRAVPCRGGAVPGADAPRFVTRRSSFVADNSAVGVAITTGGFLVVIF